MVTAKKKIVVQMELPTIAFPDCKIAIDVEFRNSGAALSIIIFLAAAG